MVFFVCFIADLNIAKSDGQIVLTTNARARVCVHHHIHKSNTFYGDTEVIKIHIMKMKFIRMIFISNGTDF